MIYDRQATQKRNCMSWKLIYEQLKKNIDLMSLPQRMHFLQNAFQMNALALVSVINHDYIYGLHLF